MSLADSVEEIISDEIKENDLKLYCRRLKTCKRYYALNDAVNEDTL